MPKEGASDEYDAARRRLLEVDAGLQQELSRWRRELRDSSIELWTPSVANGQTTEPFQLAVAEKTLQKQGTPEERARIRCRLAFPAPSRHLPGTLPGPF